MADTPTLNLEKANQRSNSDHHMAAQIASSNRKADRL
jgi:hypothetical protein